MFKIGDEVEAIRKNWNIEVGEVVKVVEIHPNGNLGVETKNYSGGHDCAGYGKAGHCWWVAAYAYALHTADLENK